MRKLLQVAALAMAIGIPATAAPITIDVGGWGQFPFFSVGAPVVGSPFTFTAVSDVVLRVTDAGLSGDRFEVFVNSVSFGETSLPGSIGDAIGFDYAGAFADARWSSGSYLLGPGEYSIEIFPTQMPHGSVQPPSTLGLGALRVDTVDTSVVPEPAYSLATLVMLGLMLKFARRFSR